MTPLCGARCCCLAPDDGDVAVAIVAVVGAVAFIAVAAAAAVAAALAAHVVAAAALASVAASAGLVGSPNVNPVAITMLASVVSIGELLGIFLDCCFASSLGLAWLCAS